MSKRTRTVLKLLSIAVIIGLILVLIGACINLYVVHTGGKQIYTVEQMRGSQADCILVLGAGLKPDGSPSDMLRDRLSFACDLWNEGVSDTVLISGDRASEAYDEVTAMKNYLLAHGVPEEAIVEDPMGYSTSESLKRAKDIFGYENVAVVTQRYHLYRALYIAQKIGLDAKGVNSDPFTYRGQTLRDIREFAARIKDFFKFL
ncbi:MAG: SanA/YdcF family protein [Eubacteriales bacterium]|jgi:SanA protein